MKGYRYTDEDIELIRKQATLTILEDVAGDLAHACDLSEEDWKERKEQLKENTDTAVQALRQGLKRLKMLDHVIETWKQHEEV